MNSMFYIITYFAGVLSGISLIVGVAYFSIKKKKKQLKETIEKNFKERSNK